MEASTTETFDPYHRWLGISQADQPPNHYRLLGVDLFESDPQVIVDAAAQRMAHVRTYQLGPNSAKSQTILNELGVAKACLLDPQKKSLYDEQLRAALAQRNPISCSHRRNVLVVAAGMGGVVLVAGLTALPWVLRPKAKVPMTEQNHVTANLHRGAAPPSAVAPFSAAEAKEHQTRWAERIKVSVEFADSIGMRLVLIPPGDFDMGSPQQDLFRVLNQATQRKWPQWFVERWPAQAPQHHVRLTRPVYLGRFEVTVREFQTFVGDSGYRTDAERDGQGGFGNDDKGKWIQKPEFTWRNPGFQQTDEHPVVNVSWNDAVAFCRWLGQKEMANYRLPTEAEWEYACRAGSTTCFGFGDDAKRLDEYAWNAENAGNQTHPIGKKKPNAWGLYDMHGNAWEWCADWWAADYYAKSSMIDPVGPDSGAMHAFRGGSWGGDDSVAYWCAFRNCGPPDHRGACFGFRVVRTIAR